jgi:hypothetical protein
MWERGLEYIFLGITIFGLTYPILEGGGGGVRPKGLRKVYRPRVIFNILEPLAVFLMCALTRYRH